MLFRFLCGRIFFVCLPTGGWQILLEEPLEIEGRIRKKGFRVTVKTDRSQRGGDGTILVEARHKKSGRRETIPLDNVVLSSGHKRACQAAADEHQRREEILAPMRCPRTI